MGFFLFQHVQAENREGGHVRQVEHGRFALFQPQGKLFQQAFVVVCLSFPQRLEYVLFHFLPLAALPALTGKPGHHLLGQRGRGENHGGAPAVLALPLEYVAGLHQPMGFQDPQHLVGRRIAHTEFACHLGIMYWVLRFLVQVQEAAKEFPLPTGKFHPILLSYPKKPEKV